jgi:4'-phosphopantetheinyl transferase
VSRPINWEVPPAQLALGEGELHVWRASLEIQPHIRAELEGTLSPDETLRAHRFHFPRDRNAFIAARGILRRLLGMYVNRPAAQVGIRYGRIGKPELCSQQSDQPIRFNLSHSRGLAVFAFCQGREIGIDLEFRRSDVATEEIVARYFSAREIEEWRALPPDSRAQGFFNCWTRKEAYIKALGEGLQVPLDSFDVTLTPGSPAVFRRGVEGQWHLCAFAAKKDYPAALVYSGSRCEVRFLSWDTDSC